MTLSTGWVRVLILLLVSAYFQDTSRADSFAPPFTGLNPGDTYHLAFVTHHKFSVLSDDIAFYNSIVMQEAALPGSTTENFGIEWRAIASTPSVDARVNASVADNVPIYELDGSLLATGYSGLWSGSLLTGLDLSQFLTSQYTQPVWTGSQANGTKFNRLELGSQSGATIVGYADHPLLSWINAGHGFDSQNVFHLYAVSEPLTVPDVTVVPEPATAVGLLTMLGIVGAVATWRKYRETRRSARATC